MSPPKVSISRPSSTSSTSTCQRKSKIMFTELVEQVDVVELVSLLPSSTRTKRKQFSWISRLCSSRPDRTCHLSCSRSTRSPAATTTSWRKSAESKVAPTVVVLVIVSPIAQSSKLQGKRQRAAPGITSPLVLAQDTEEKVVAMLETGKSASAGCLTLCPLCCWPLLCPPLCVLLRPRTALVGRSMCIVHVPECFQHEQV
mmetsp:Transcript_26536/g.40316  ORF Transcript_26536/g.40316 Transcript_26536/m.40316 type:complete len:200 (-) Transcript_26536:58-657(-)